MVKDINSSYRKPLYPYDSFYFCNFRAQILECMNTLIANFSKQLAEAIEIGKNANLKPGDRSIHNVLITGLGGSGIGGSIVSQLVAQEATVPINVNKTYSIPGYVNEHTLVIVSSYSGNTEETLSALKEALAKNAEVVCITSGGEALTIAKEQNLNHIVIPGGSPPRAALGYSLTQQFYVLAHYGIIQNNFEQPLEATVQLLSADEEDIRMKAKSIAHSLSGKMPIIYATAPNEGIAVRFRQQLNENSKMLCWHHVFPEMNHNELVGWANGNENQVVVILRHVDDYNRTQTRINISKEIFEEKNAAIIEMYSKGESPIARNLYLIHLCDWVSYYVAEHDGTDPIEIKVIDYLKSELAKL